jgi:hypothetical protein
MKIPIDKNAVLAIMLLRSIGKSQDDVSQDLGCGKQKVIDVEKWIAGHKYEEVREFCNDQALKNVMAVDLLHLVSLTDGVKKQLTTRNAQYILWHYGKTKTKYDKSIYLRPDFQDHFGNLVDAAGKLRRNIKIVVDSKGELGGNITLGEIKVVKDRQTEIIKLENVDRLYAACLLEHLNEMYPNNGPINSLTAWENYDTKQKVSILKESVYDVLKSVSHSLQPTGCCHICKTFPLD